MIVVVGTGIFGLSVAEYLSRTMPVCLVSNNHPFAGSNAAAANLATKAQLFGRDAHFQIKLNAKKNYQYWVRGLLDELDSPIKLDSVFRLGNAVEIFENKTECEMQRGRITQPKIELEKRNLGVQPFWLISENILGYKEEAWIDAKLFITTLKNVLLKRNVKTFEMDVSNFQSHEDVLKYFSAKKIVLCTGAWTQSVLNHFGFDLLPKARYSIGSTIDVDSSFDEFSKQFDDRPVVVEIRSIESKNKVVLSGSKSCLYLSSTSRRIETAEKEVDEALLLEDCQSLIWYTQKHCNLNFDNFKIRTGLRVGFGHSELVVNKVNLDVVVCCGAHKSGFMFAPEVGALVQTLL